MRVTRRTATGLSLMVIMAAAASVPTLAQDDAEVEASASPAATEAGRRDLYLDMPYYIGGFEPQIVMTRGEEHFVNLGPEAPTRLALEGLLGETGAEVEDLVSGYALVSQEGFFSFVVALRVNGAAPGTVAPVYLPILIGGLIDPTRTESEVGGKEVTVISSVGDDGEYVELYVYDEGDTVWMVEGPLDVVETTIANLPQPLADEPAA